MTLHIFARHFLRREASAPRFTYSRHAGFVEALLMRAPLIHLCRLSRAYLRRTERAADDVDVHLRRLQVRSGARWLGATRRPTVRSRDDVVVAARRGIGPGFRAWRGNRVTANVRAYRGLKTATRQDVHQELLFRIVDDYGGKRGLKLKIRSFLTERELFCVVSLHLDTGSLGHRYALRSLSAE